MGEEREQLAGNCVYELMLLVFMLEDYKPICPDSCLVLLVFDPTLSATQ